MKLQRLAIKVWFCTLALRYTPLLCTVPAVPRERGDCKSCPCSQPGLKTAFKADQHSNEWGMCNDTVKGNEMQQLDPPQ